MTIDKDEFLFFYQDSEDPLAECPAGVEVIKVGTGQGHSWSVRAGSQTVPLGEVASIANGKVLTKAQAKAGPVPVIGGGRVPQCFHNKSNAPGECFTVSKSGAYSGFVWWHEYPVWASDCMIVRSLDEEDYLTFYLFLCMKAKQEEIYARQQGTGQPHVYLEHIADFPIPKLSLSAQWERIQEARDVTRQRVDAEQQQSAELESALAGIEHLYEGTGEAAKPVLKADYRGATPRQVAQALLRYRPKGKGCKE